MGKRDAIRAAAVLVLCTTAWMIGGQQGGKAAAAKAKESEASKLAEIALLRAALEKSTADAVSSAKAVKQKTAEQEAYKATVAGIVKQLDKASEDVTVADLEKANFERLNPETQFALLQAIRQIKESGIGALTEEQLRMMDRSPITRRFANQEIKKLREKEGKKEEAGIYDYIKSEVGELTLADYQAKYKQVMKEFRLIAQKANSK